MILVHTPCVRQRDFHQTNEALIPLLIYNPFYDKIFGFLKTNSQQYKVFYIHSSFFHSNFQYADLILKRIYHFNRYQVILKDWVTVKILKHIGV